MIQRQTGKYDPSDLEDRYETRLRAMIDAKLKGEGIDLEAPVALTSPSNVIDLMAALKKSLATAPSEPPVSSKRKKAAGDVRQAGLKLPIKGGKAAPVREEETPVPLVKAGRKRA